MPQSSISNKHKMFRIEMRTFVKPSSLEVTIKKAYNWKGLTS